MGHARDRYLWRLLVPWLALLGACSAAVEPPAGPPAQIANVAISGGHSCALDPLGDVHCWGDGMPAEPAPEGSGFTQVGVAKDFACALERMGRVRCWGQEPQYLSVPSDNFVKLAVGPWHACGIREDGSLSCWVGLMGSDPVRDPPAGRFVEVAIGSDHACAIRAGSGEVACWGKGYHGETQAPGGAFVKLCAGVFFSCGIRVDETLDCWGSNRNSALGFPSGKYKEVACMHEACAIAEDGHIECWTTAVGLPPEGEFSQVSCGFRSTQCCAVGTDSKLACWSWDPSGP